MEVNVFEQLLTAVFAFLLGLADKYAWITIVLAIVGGLYVVLLALQPVVVAIAKWTKTQKDDAFWAKVYDFLTDYGPCFVPVAKLFREKTGWPENKKTVPQDGKDVK